ncbi:unnamed protein product [Paramecium sonneborni]|uniref:Dynamin GTPase effector domain-containing protein n=1 Tax=Paramecium sonneborni TaxID=65129 RepID=A0A8S1RM39_9CILI|nr:unnamed protein product [Paramecium sonneborni]
MLEGGCFDITRKELIGSFQLNFWKKNFQINPFDVLSDDEIRRAIKNGIKQTLFFNEEAFVKLIRQQQQISRLRMPSLECSHIKFDEKYFEELRRVVNQISISEIERSDIFANRVSEVIQNLLNKFEIRYIYSSHPDFVSGMKIVHKHEQRQDNNNKFKNRKRNCLFNGINKLKIFFNFCPFKYNKQTELNTSNLDKLNKMRKTNINSQKQQKSQQLEESQILQQQLVINKIISVNQLYFMNDPKRQLLQVPNTQKITEKPSKQKLVNRNGYDKGFTIKKNIFVQFQRQFIIFLVNQSRNFCERELIRVLCKQELVDELLQKNQSIQKSKVETKQSLISLRTYLNLLNDLDQKILTLFNNIKLIEIHQKHTYYNQSFNQFFLLVQCSIKTQFKNLKISRWIKSQKLELNSQTFTRSNWEVIDFIIIQILRLIRKDGQMKKIKLFQKLIKNQEIFGLLLDYRKVEQIILLKIIRIAHQKEDQRCKIDRKIYKYYKIKIILKFKVFQKEICKKKIIYQEIPVKMIKYDPVMIIEFSNSIIISIKTRVSFKIFIHCISKLQLQKVNESFQCMPNYIININYIQLNKYNGRRKEI